MTPSEKDNNAWVRIRQENMATIKNALGIILGNAELLERERGITRDPKERLETVAVQVYRIEELLGSPGREE